MKRRRSPDGIDEYYEDGQSSKRSNTNVNFSSPYAFEIRNLRQQNVELSNQLAQCQKNIQKLIHKNHTLKTNLTRTDNLYKNLLQETTKMIEMCRQMPNSIRHILDVFMGFLNQHRETES